MNNALSSILLVMTTTFTLALFLLSGINDDSTLFTKTLNKKSDSLVKGAKIESPVRTKTAATQTADSKGTAIGETTSNETLGEGGNSVDEMASTTDSPPKADTGGAEKTEDTVSVPNETIVAGNDPGKLTTDQSRAGAGVKELYDRHCARCHDNEPPRIGNQQEWVERFARGLNALQKVMIEDPTHQTAGRGFSSKQVHEVLSFMMAETFWPSSSN